MAKKVALALVVLAASIVVAACGGSQEGDVLGAAGTSTAPRPPRGGGPPRTDPAKGCEEQGVNTRLLYPGACTEGGVRYVVANYGGVVRLRSLLVAITDVGVAPGFEGARRSIGPRYDAFLRIGLQVQNRGRTPQRFGLGQTMLGIAENNYLERTDVERRIYARSLARVNGGTIGPGETLRGDVVYDITEADYQQLQRRGRFFIWNFGQRASPELRRGAQIGQIRLYAGEPEAPPQQQQQSR